MAVLAKKKAGRPSKLTDDRYKIIIDNLTLGMPATKVVNLAGVAYSTFRLWVHTGEEIAEKLQQNPALESELNENEQLLLDFSQAVKEAEARGMRNNLALIQKAARGDPENDIKPQWQAAAWLLERQYPEYFAKKTGVEADIQHSGNISVSINIEEVAERTEKAIGAGDTDGDDVVDAEIELEEIETDDTDD